MFAKSALSAVVALVALGYAAGAQAGSAVHGQGDTLSVTVRTDGLDLNSEGDARVALNRINFAAQRICGERPDPRALSRQAAYKSCMKATVEQTVASLGNPTMAALSGVEKPTVLAAAPR